MKRARVRNMLVLLLAALGTTIDGEGEYKYREVQTAVDSFLLTTTSTCINISRIPLCISSVFPFKLLLRTGEPFYRQAPYLLPAGRHNNHPCNHLLDSQYKNSTTSQYFKTTSSYNMGVPDYGAAPLAKFFLVVRIISLIAMICIVGVTANFVSEIVSTNVQPPREVVATLAIVRFTPNAHFDTCWLT